MKRIVLMGAAIAALLTAGIPAAASASATAHHTTHHKKTARTKTVTTHVSCTLSLTTVAPPGSSGVEAGTTSGANFGNSICASSRPGVTRQLFSIDSAGDMTGKLAQWFATGSIHGTYSLTAASISGPPTASSFGKAKYAGTVTITGASGMLKGITGSGTLACNTPDSLHYTCKEKLTLSAKVMTRSGKTS